MKSHSTLIDYFSFDADWSQLPTIWQQKVLDQIKIRLKKYFHLSGNSYFSSKFNSDIISFIHLETEIEFNLIPGGSFNMGSTRGLPDEKPIHKVSIPPLLVGRSPVTEKQWFNVEECNKKIVENGNYPKTDLSWNDCQNWLRKTHGGLRMPSEAEWEYFCRAGSTTDYFCGNPGNLKNYSWYVFDSDLDKETWIKQPVKRLLPNDFGLYDVVGNVNEWCADHYKNFHNVGNSHLPYTSNKAHTRVYRGGSWLSSLECCRSSARYHRGPNYREFRIGFRPVVSLEPFFTS